MPTDNETTANLPLPTDLDPVAPAARPAKVKKPRKKRAPNKPKVKPVDDRPVEISDDDPALQTAPDPRIDAVAAAQAVILARAETEAQVALDKLAAARKLDAATTTTPPQNVQIREVGMKLGDLQKRLNESRNKPVVVQPPQAPTARQQDTINAEIAAGQRRVAHFAAQDKARVPLPPDPKEPINTPVYRPADFVPDINSKDPAIGSQDLK